MTCPPCTHDCREGRDCPARNKQELVKIVQYNCTCGRTMKFESENGIVAPQRTWVDLTEVQIQNVYFEVLKEHLGAPMPWGQVQFGKAVLEKFKEKNT